MSVGAVLLEIEEDTATGKALVDSLGIPLSGQDLADFTSHMDDAKADATAAMADPYYAGLDSPTELPAGGGDTPYTDLCALCAGQALIKYNADEDRQGQLNRLYTIEQRADDAISEVR